MSMRKQTLAGVPRTPCRPQCRESVHIQRFQIVPWSGSYSVPQLLFLGNVLWHFSWPQRWHLNTTTTIYSLLDLTWFLSPRSGLVQSHSDFSIWLRNLTSSFRSLTGLSMLTPLLTSDLEVPINFALLLLLQSQFDSVEWSVIKKKDFFPQGANTDSSYSSMGHNI